MKIQALIVESFKHMGELELIPMKDGVIRMKITGAFFTRYYDFRPDFVKDFLENHGTFQDMANRIKEEFDSAPTSNY